MPSTVTLTPKGPGDSGSVQVSDGDKDWLFVAGQPVDNVPDKVVKALDALKANYTTGKTGE